jgi:GAF domain-containing protein
MSADIIASASRRGRDIVLGGASVRDVLISLSKLAEEVFPRAVAGYTLVDPTGTFINEATFPSLPGFERAIVSIPVDAHAGTCVEAIRSGSVVGSNDILGDIRFEVHWRDLCLRCGIKSLQSVPIRTNGAIAGTFVLGYRTVSQDARWDFAAMDVFAGLARDAAELHRARAADADVAPKRCA